MMDFKFGEQTCKMMAKLILLDQSKQLIIPDYMAMIGLEMMSRDDELGDIMRRRRGVKRNNQSPVVGSGAKRPMDSCKNQGPDGSRGSRGLDPGGQESVANRTGQVFTVAASKAWLNKSCLLNGNQAKIKRGKGIKALVKSKTESYEMDWHAVDCAMRNGTNPFNFVVNKELCTERK